MVDRFPGRRVADGKQICCGRRDPSSLSLCRDDELKARAKAGATRGVLPLRQAQGQDDELKKQGHGRIG